MTTAAQVLKIAASQLGIKENPANSNKVKYTAAYGMIGAWCAMFQWWCFREAGAANLYYGGKKTGYTPTLLGYYKAHGQAGNTPRVGAMVFFNWGGRPKGVPEHVGIVEKIINSTTIQTIEGNTSSGSNSNGGQVQRRLRGTGSICGYAYPAYTTTAAAKPATTTAAVAKPATTTKPALPTGTILKQGMTGAKVAALQRWLMSVGISVGKAGADGVFGPDTKAAIKRLQTKAGLTGHNIDGEWGPITRKAAQKWAT